MGSSTAGLLPVLVLLCQSHGFVLIQGNARLEHTGNCLQKASCELVFTFGRECAVG